MFRATKQLDGLPVNDYFHLLRSPCSLLRNSKDLLRVHNGYANGYVAADSPARRRPCPLCKPTAGPPVTLLLLIHRGPRCALTPSRGHHRPSSPHPHATPSLPSPHQESPGAPPSCQPHPCATRPSLAPFGERNAAYTASSQAQGGAARLGGPRRAS